MLGLCLELPSAPSIARAEVCRHRAAGRRRLGLDVGVGVELGEEFLDRQHAQGEHERLITVVTGTKVPFSEGVSHCDLGDFLAVAKDPEFRLAGEHLLAAEETRLPAEVGDPVVANNRLPGNLRRQF